MVELKLQSAGVSVREIDQSGPSNVDPVGVPAGVIGTANQGPAFVPVTVGSVQDLVSVFGDTDAKDGMLAMFEWLRNATAGTYLRVLGAGKGEKRLTTGNNIGSVESAGFVVGEEQPNDSGNFGSNTDAVENGPLGRTYFLGAYMSESAGSTVFSDAGIAIDSPHPIVRGVLMAASGVVLRLSSSFVDSADPSTSTAAVAGGGKGHITGTVDLSAGKQEFVLLLNGHKELDPSYPNVITASFDTTAPNYFPNILNEDPLKLQDAGYLLYTHYDIHTSQAVLTGTGIAGVTGSSDLISESKEQIAFLTTGSAGRNAGTTTVPNYENFEDRFQAAETPWITSQKFGGSTVNLFKLVSRSDGAVSSDKWKVSIENVTPSTSDTDLYGKFDVVVRDFGDNDDEKVVLEQYRGLSLNPSSDRFIAKIIGDKNIYFDFDKALGSQKLVEEGSYPNKSNRIRVKLPDDVVNADIDQESLPVGFRGPRHLVTSGSDPMTAPGDASPLKETVEYPIPLRENLTVGVSPKQVVNKNFYWGVQFQQKTSLTEPNSSVKLDETIRSYTKYFPNFMTSLRNVHVGDNAGTADSNGTVLDSDLFNNNSFSLENVQVVTGSDTKADVKTIDQWTYVRQGGISSNAANKTRGLDVSTDLSVPAVRTVAKFSIFLQGGFDGVNVFNKNESDMSNRAIIEEMSFSDRGQNNGPTVKTYKKALEVLEETSDVDINLMAIPGIRHNVITDSAILTAEGRFDALYLMDVEEKDTVNTVVTSSLQDVSVNNTVTAHSARSLDSSFAAAYFPDVVMTDPSSGALVQAPPSVVALGAMALNDALSHPWFAPAGFSRGVLSSVERATVSLKRDKLDDLQSADINPIVSFPGGPGVTIWGQNTLLSEANSLEKVNVRRMLLDVRRKVREVGRTFLFEPNREETLERFSNQVRPILRRIQEQAGIDKFRVLINTETTTQADVDNNVIRGQIVLKPVRSLEFISLDFVVNNQGAEIQ